MTYEEYRIEIRRAEHNGLTEGQRAYNLLSLYQPMLAPFVAGTIADPRDDNGALDAFYGYVEANWRKT